MSQAAFAIVFLRRRTVRKLAGMCNCQSEPELPPESQLELPESELEPPESKLELPESKLLPES